MKYLFTLALIASAMAMQAQVINIDRAGQDSAAPKPLSAFLSFSIDMDEQKANIFDEDGSLEIAWQKKKNAMIFGAISEIVTGGPQSNLLNSGSYQLRDRMFINHRLHPELFTQYQFDGVKGLRRRALGGANARYVFKDKGSFRLFAATGLMYEYEDWDYNGVLYVSEIPKDASDIMRRVMKSTSYVRMSKFIGKNVDCSIVLFYQAQPQYFLMYPRLAEFFQLSVGITEHIALTLEYDSMYDTRPVVPIKKYYFSFNEGLSVRF